MYNSSQIMQGFFFCVNILWFLGFYEAQGNIFWVSEVNILWFGRSQLTFFTLPSADGLSSQ